MRYRLAVIFCGVLALCNPVNSSAQTFADVPTDYWAYTFIETLVANGITSGCGGGNYCPEAPVTRAQMAVFLERSMKGSDYVPPPATGNVFQDVAASAFAANFIEQLLADGITGGCGNNNYCPYYKVSDTDSSLENLPTRFKVSENTTHALHHRSQY